MRCGRLRGKEFGVDNNIMKEIAIRLKERQKYINGTEFENLCYPIFELEVRPKLAYHKGHNINNKPVGYTVDFFTNDLKIAGQCGTNEKDIDKKIEEDIAKSTKFLEDVEEVFVFINKPFKGDIKLLTKNLKQKYQKEIKIYDSHEIAKKIYENPTNSILERVKKYLGKDIYELIVNNKIVSFLPYFERKSYFNRKALEYDIKKRILDDNIIIFKGVSGIGKSTLAKNIVYDIKKYYDYVFWIDENILKNSLNLTNLLINNKSINLEYYIKNFKTLIIFDNLQDSSYINEFIKINKNSSMIVTTKQYFSDEYLNNFYFDIPFFTNDEKKEFLGLSNVEKIPGLPLILKILIPYKEYIDDLLEQIYDLDDDKKTKKIIERILIKISDKKEIKLLCNFIYFNNRNLFIDFIKFNNLLPQALSLKNRFILEKSDDFFEIHEAIFLVIKSFLTDKNYCNKEIFERTLLSYLEKKLKQEDLDYYIFIHFYNDGLKQIYYHCQNEKLKKYLLYILVQNRWASDGEWFVKEIGNFSLSFQDEIDYYLFIEKEEIFLFLNKDKNDYEEILKNTIISLEKLLENKINNRLIIIDIKHHLAKTYYKLGKYNKKNYQKAYNILVEIINECGNCYKSKLQLFRILSQEKVKNNDILKQLIEEFIELSESKNWKYLTVILDFYQNILKNKFKDYHECVLKNDFFVLNVLKALEQNIDQIYKVLKDIINKLKWIKDGKNSFNELCSYICEYIKSIDIFSFDLNRKKSLSIIVGECKCNKAFYLKLLESIKEELEDYEKFQQVKILNSIEEYENALKLLDSIDLENYKGKEFVFQQYAKAYLGVGQCKEAFKYIEKALESKNIKQYYKNSFEKDKQKIEDCLKNESN